MCFTSARMCGRRHEAIRRASSSEWTGGHGTRVALQLVAGAAPTPPSIPRCRAPRRLVGRTAGKLSGHGLGRGQAAEHRTTRASGHATGASTSSTSHPLRKPTDARMNPLRPLFRTPTTRRLGSATAKCPPRRQNLVLTSRRQLGSSAPRPSKQPADEADFISIVDNPPQLVRSGRRHGPGLILLGILPLLPIRTPQPRLLLTSPAVQPSSP